MIACWCQSRVLFSLKFLHSVVVCSLLTVLIILMAISTTDKLSTCGDFLLDCVGKSATSRPRESLGSGSQLAKNYDWIGLDQFTILCFFMANLLVALVSCLLNYRKCLLLTILLYASYLVHLTLIEFSDNRRNHYRMIHRIEQQTSPNEPDRNQKSHLFIQTPDSRLNLGLKYTLASLFLLELILLKLSYGLGRYTSILSAAEPKGVTSNLASGSLQTSANQQLDNWSSGTTIGAKQTTVEAGRARSLSPIGYDLQS